LLNSTWKALYQQAYLLTNCQASGITDTLRIFVQQSEIPPYGPMLIQAPVLNPANPKTTIAAYGKRLCPVLTPTQWSTLPSIFVTVSNGMSDGINATYSYIPTTQFLHEGEIVTVTGFPNTGSPAHTSPLNVTAQIKNVVNLAGIVNATAVEANVVTIFAPNSFAPGMLVTLNNLSVGSFLNNQSFIIQSAESTNFTVNFIHATYSKTVDTGTVEVSTFQIPNTTVFALSTPSPTSQAGLVTPTLQSAYYFSNGQYILGQAPINVAIGVDQGQSWDTNSVVFRGQIVVDSNGNTQIALNAGTTGAGNTVVPGSPATLSQVWNAEHNGLTSDNNIVWRNAGKDAFSDPRKWVGVLSMSYEFDQDSTQSECTLGFTGEVGNWDPLHQYGLVAPRLNQVWEISGQPQDQNFIFGLY
jgi:hypothetical protein